jgi:hypothetical protein
VKAIPDELTCPKCQKGTILKAKWLMGAVIINQAAILKSHLM